MIQPSLEPRYAQVARSLASHLLHYARERDDNDRKAIAILHHELCQLYKTELNGNHTPTES